MRSFAIVPAAGRSVRMGSPKLLLPWRDATVMDAVLRAWTASRVTRTVVVCCPADRQLIEICRQYDVEVVVPAVPPPEMKVSVQLSLALLAERYHPVADDVWLLAPADMPLLTSHTIDALLDQHEPSAPAILTPVSAGRRGHPVLFPWPTVALVDQLDADEGLNALRQRFPARFVELEHAPILHDLDTPQDYESLRSQDATDCPFPHESAGDGQAR